MAMAKAWELDAKAKDQKRPRSSPTSQDHHRTSSLRCVALRCVVLRCVRVLETGLYSSWWKL